MGRLNKKITVDEIYVSRVRFIHVEKEPGVWEHRSIEKPLPETGDANMDAVVRLLAKKDRVEPEDVCDLLQMDRKTCNSYFVFRTGLPLPNFLLDYKMKIVGELLRFTQMELKEIAQRFGYTNGPSVTHQFKRRYGMTPLHYRQKYQAKPPELRYL